MTPVIERLDRRHMRGQFTCGVAALDAYLKQYATQDMRRRVAICYVLREADASSLDVIGYYTLSASHIDVGVLSTEAAHRLPRYPFLPTALIGRLAVDNRHRGQSLGELLLADAVKRVRDAEVAVYALEVDAIDDGAAAFYEHFGFQRFSAGSLRLYLPIGSLRSQLAGQ